MGIMPRNRGGEGGIVAVDMLSERATMMRESVQKSQSITDNMVSILGSFDHRLSALETAMRPTQIRTHAIRKAHENIDRTLKAADVILSQFDLSRQAEAKILKGPHEDLESYLEAIEQLRNNIRFFNNNKSFKSSDGVLNNANSLLAKAISKLEDEFKQLLSSYSKPVEPERLFECLPTSMRPSTGSPGDQDSSSKNHLPSSHGEHNHGTDDTVYTPPTLIPPRILPLLHDLSQQMVQAGHQQQLVKIYSNTPAPPLFTSCIAQHHASSLTELQLYMTEPTFRAKMSSSIFSNIIEAKNVKPSGQTKEMSLAPAFLRHCFSPYPFRMCFAHHWHFALLLFVPGFKSNKDKKHLVISSRLPKPWCVELSGACVGWGGTRDVRFPVLEESLRKLGVEKLSKDDVQKMQWEVLEFKIGNWIHYMRIAVKLLFAAERKVCDQMFEGFEQIKDQCFADVTTGSVAMLLSFGDAIAKSKRSPEKLFVLLDMYEIMRELHSEIELLFRGKSCNEIRESAFGLSKRLAQTAQETFRDFEEAVEKDATKTAVSDGTVHPLTSYVINYVKFLFDYQSTLKQLFQEFENGDSNSQLATVTMRIMQALQTNLDGKSKQYKDPSLTNLFLMNNIHYMVRSVRRSEAKDLLGDDWVQRHRRVVQQHANQYKRIAWAKILQCLSIQGLTSSGGSNSMGVDGQNSSGVSRALVKERLKTFNIQFEDLHQRQSQWTVPDTELRESLRLAVAEVLLPAYRSFIKRFGPMVESGKNPQKYIRYSAEDLERMLGEFFEGKTLNEPKR
ncbi:hypothetical protein MTR67_047081 [Solanum verrucosum]|uniref:Exocyst subunit Exo70 family protein n=1 Tax=Solanum verrucosum TaxID=315347 RepID=A0AAF0UZ41_SOLVR|nr:hypothetical protein MTR67_047081 [Solanum verrucosum]